jgi:hypothetical protein
MFTDLADSKSKDFDGMASGSFVDFHGSNVTIKSRDLAEIVRKTKIAIESTVTESGEIVGLPIDEDGHDHRGGAGWIVDVSLDRNGSKIRFTPKWTDIGIDLIKKNIRRFFSVSVDLANKVIMGGSLTNWPATRDAKSGEILLRPIELSMNLYATEKSNMKNKTIRDIISEIRTKEVETRAKEFTMTDLQETTRAQMEAAVRKHKKDNPDDDTVSEEDIDGLTEMSDEQVAALAAKCGKKKDSNMAMRMGLKKIANTINRFVSGSAVENESDFENKKGDLPMATEMSNQTLTELLHTPEAVLELGRMAEERAKEFVSAERRKGEIVEFASTLVGGTKDKPFGLPVQASEVVELLLSLPPAQATAVQKMLTKTLEASVNFGEMGFGGEFLFGRPRLAAQYRESLQIWVDSGKSVDTFFSTNSELGKSSDYNLTEFISKAG